MPGDTFRDGFIEGFKLMRGNNVVVPVAPAGRVPNANQTAFRLGVAAGIQAGGGPRLP